MNILLINGSPRGERSNSLKLAQSFLSGFAKARATLGVADKSDVLHLSTLDIAACKGCFACWKATPGQCCIHDNMAEVLALQREADLVVWSFPLYYFGVPGTLKNMIDRQLPLALPFMSERDDGYGSGSHDMRYADKSRAHVLVSTCGFWSAEGNYDGVRCSFDHMLGKGNYESIFCGQGELFGVAELSARTDAYLAAVARAGAEYAAGGISRETCSELAQPLYPKEVFEAMADASWGINRETGERESPDLVLVRQMAALYNKAAYDGRDRVLEMRFTDLGTCYQILLGKDGSEVVCDASLTATTCVITSFELWCAISRGEIGGAQALGEHRYRVEGDFSLMVDWDKFFGAAAGTGMAGDPGDGGNAPEAPTMLSMLIPWICFWVAVSINASVGSVIALAASALTPILLQHHKRVLWDKLSVVAVCALSLSAAFGADGNMVITLGYLVFGLMWLASCAVGEPLCATYVKYGYGGDAALENPLFMKTNYILALCWGALYVATALWTWFGLQTGAGTFVLIVNSAMPLAMGLFTAWFQNWYPAHLARG
ncbi:MAG: flavodoxin family protein [Coriobacteriales bacterium]|nr:flavodoxin family protein [Coriobacteriales bacterium]